MRTHEVRDFSKRGDALPIPNLIEVQIESYQKFLQKEVDPAKRKNDGLEALLREVFPIESYDGNLRLEYISYDLSEPRYTTDECRALRLTFGMPFRIQVRLVRTKKDALAVRIDQSSKIPATTFLRALDKKYSSTEQIIKEFYQVEHVKVGQL